MESENSQLLLQFYRHLTNELRYRLIVELSQGDYTARELAYRLTINGITVYEGPISHHLTKLQQFDLVRMQLIGHPQKYQLNTERLESLIEATLTQQASLRQNIDQQKLEKLQSLTQAIATPQLRKALLEEIQEQERERARMGALMEFGEEGLIKTELLIDKGRTDAEIRRRGDEEKFLTYGVDA